MDLLKLLRSFGLDIDSVASAMNVDPADLKRMDKDALVQRFTPRGH